MSSENIPWEYHAWDLKNHLIETGKIKIDLNRFADALIDLDKAIDVYPKDSIIFIENGKSKESNEDFIGALNDYDRAAKFSLIYTYRGYVKSRIGDIKGAVKDYEKAETLKRKYYYIYFLRARIKEKNKNTVFWLIDPIDGTKEYISGKDEYTLNAALVVDKKPIIGFISTSLKVVNIAVSC